MLYARCLFNERWGASPPVSSGINYFKLLYKTNREQDHENDKDNRRNREEGISQRVGRGFERLEEARRSVVDQE